MMLALLLLAQSPWSEEGWWTRAPEEQAPLPAIRRNARNPLSDTENKGKWKRYDALWDDFDGKRLNRRKWLDHNPGWRGRQPAWFDPKNVSVSTGLLRLAATVGDAPADLAADGYKSFRTAAVQSVETVKYGYFEIRAKPMSSHVSSAFWFYDTQPAIWTEIDVFEIGGQAPGFERKCNITVHAWKTPTVSEHKAIGDAWIADRDFASDFRTYGFEWNEQELRFYVDGTLVRKGPNTVWHQPLTMNFDSETMPEWFGLPTPDELPAEFRIDYIHAWKQSKR